MDETLENLLDLMHHEVALEGEVCVSTSLEERIEALMLRAYNRGYERGVRDASMDLLSYLKDLP